jgi:aryl-alcohol dehydrogenase-like predicted oxidoreductase
MEYRRLGRSGLFVSALTLGTMTFGGQGGLQQGRLHGRRRGEKAGGHVP